jgi:hypothetical protein
MTTQETLAQIEHLLVENEETLRDELAKDLINRLMGQAQNDFLTIGFSNVNKQWKEIPEAVETMVVVNWLKKVKQEMENE